MQKLQELGEPGIKAVLEKIASEIQARLKDGPNLRDEHLALIDGLRDELPPEDIAEWKQEVAAQWARAEAEVEGKVVQIGRREPTFGVRGFGPKPKPAEQTPKDEAAGPQIEVAPSVSGDAKPAPEVEVAEKGGLPAVIPVTKPLSNEGVSRWNDAMVAMNEQHAVIENYGGKAVIASWEPKRTNLNQRELVYQGKDSFLLRYSNRTVQIEVSDGEGGYKLLRLPLGAWWLHHRDRRQHRGVIFQPGGPDIVGECLNIWQDWGVKAWPGDWSLIRKHIEEVIAGGNAEFADYVVKWIAWSIQNPAAQAEVALVLIGHKGAGKGTLVRVLQRIFGAHAFQVTSREEVIGKFNGHLQDCVLFVADEAYWGGDKRCVGRLQGMITEPTLPIERKGFDLILVPNYLHVVMLAEPGWVIPAGRYERRYGALTVSDGRLGDRAYFNALHQQIARGVRRRCCGTCKGWSWAAGTQGKSPKAC
jgi:hypothetical protein